MWLWGTGGVKSSVRQPERLEGGEDGKEKATSSHMSWEVTEAHLWLGSAWHKGIGALQLQYPVHRRLSFGSRFQIYAGSSRDHERGLSSVTDLEGESGIQISLNLGKGTLILFPDAKGLDG